MAGFFGDLFDSFTGKSQLREGEAGFRAAASDLKRGRRRARGEYTGGRDAALAYIDPYIQSGGRAQNLYTGSIGARGSEGYREAYEAYEGDPFRAGSDAATENALRRVFSSYNSRGMGDSGASRLGVARAGMERYDQRRDLWQNRLMQAGQAGQQAAQYGAGLQYDTGNRLGDLEYGYAQQRATNNLNRGKFRADQQGVGWQNYMKMLEIGAKAAGAAATASDVRLKRDIERIGALPSGLPVYTFLYLWSDEQHVGVMAQEALAVVPDAVIEGDDGYLMVDYAKVW